MNTSVPMENVSIGLSEKSRRGVSGGLYIGLFTFFLLLYLRPQDFVPGLDKIRPVVVLMTLLSLGFLLSTTRGALKESSPFFRGLLALMAAAAWSIPFSYYQHASFDTWVDFCKVVLACYLIIKIADSFQRIERIILLINLVLVVFAVDIIFKYRAGQDHETILGMVYGQFENPNDLSVNFVLFLPMVYYYAIASKNIFLKLVWLCLFGIVIFGVVGCQSRGGMLGAMLVLSLLFLKTERKAIALLVGAVSVLFVLLLAPGNAFDRLGTVSHYKDESSANSRMWFYESSLRMFLHRPLTGVGMNAWPSAYATEFRHPDDPSNRWPDPHSTFFQIIGELGFPGACAFGFLLYTTFRSLSRIEMYFRQQPGCERHVSFVQCLRIGFLGFCFTAIFQSFSYYHTLYNLMALVVAIERLIPGQVSMVGMRGNSA